MEKIIRIENKEIGDSCPVFIIAEAGANHDGEIGTAKKMIEKAKEIGVDCIKFQTFSAEEFCSDKESIFTYCSQGKEVSEKMYDMFKRFEFTRDEWVEIVDYCKQLDILFMTTVQDPVNLKMMQEIGLPGIKVGSDDFDHLVNLKIFAQTGLPLIISKGMADLGEVDRIINTLREYTDKLMVMHCVSLYPADPSLLNIRQIQTLKNLYPDIIWGFSDHSQGTLASTVAVAVGAKIIEKHFTLDHQMPGPDHWFSMDIPEFTQLVKDIRLTEQALGTGNVSPSPREIEMKNIMRRRIVAGCDFPKGTVLTEDNVSFKRGEQGCFVTHWDILKGQKSALSKKKNDPIDFCDITFS